MKPLFSRIWAISFIQASMYMTDSVDGGTYIYDLNYILHCEV